MKYAAKMNANVKNIRRMKMCNDCVVINGKHVHVVGNIIWEAHTNRKDK